MNFSLEDRFRLKGKVAVTIGGSGHLGLALVKAMAESGMNVVVLDRKPPALEGPPPGDLSFLRCEATSKKELVSCRGKILKRFGRIDGLLNAAGSNAPTPFLKISEAEFRRIVEANLLSTLLACQVFG
ncbi:MAG: SDR family NAD(P)-dependent oxidoreductase, partial [Candidatus Omnitrophica bacterium]|nr:SDR family NAD(P)-dependent oxidoreductase [Candidatus Omnitrophota bacterium]